MDEFREFVRKYPKLRDDVKSGERTWQNIYEEWTLYGEEDRTWAKYRSTENNQNEGTGDQATDQNAKGGNKSALNTDGLKNIMGYFQKINPDSVNRTLGTVQKVIQIVQGFGGKTKSAPYINSPYDDWWD